MDVFLKATAGALVAMLLALILAKKEKDMAMLISLLACCMIAGVAISFLSGILDFVSLLQNFGSLDSQMLNILIKTTGVGIMAEIIGLLCSDSGNSALGKTLQILAGMIILWMALPLFTALLELMEKILGEV